MNMPKNVLYLNLVAISLLAGSCSQKNSSLLVSTQNDNYVRAESLPTKTKIKHLIILVEENEAFDKYFGTYPYAANPTDESSPRFYGVVGNKVPNNYLLLNANGFPVDAQGRQIDKFTSHSIHPQFNSILTHNPNLVNPYRLTYNTYLCYNSHQYPSELWAYGIAEYKDIDRWNLSAPGDMKLSHFVEYAANGFGGSIFLNNSYYFNDERKKEHNESMLSPYYRDVLGWGCLAPNNANRNVYNGAGVAGSYVSVSPDTELMLGRGLENITVPPLYHYESQNRRFYTERYGHVMGYYDGNSATALWNYAQHYAMNDNFHQLTYGPSTPGHINLVYGTVGPIDTTYSKFLDLMEDIVLGDLMVDFRGHLYVQGDLNPYFDKCSGYSSPDSDRPTVAVAISIPNIGDLLSSLKISWGFFSAGFTAPDTCTAYMPSQFGESTSAVSPQFDSTYSASVEPFQYSPTTSNPQHLLPAVGEAIGSGGQANHQYDLSSFISALDGNQLPAVSYLKPKAHQSSHGDYSSVGDEQNWLVNIVNKIQLSDSYKSGDTAIIIMEDDSDGGYDHVMLPPKRSFNGNSTYGPGPRLVFEIISPYAKNNYVDSTNTDQSSINHFIKYNWGITQKINQYSTDENSGALLNMFDFTKKPELTPLLLYCDGSVYDGSSGTPAPVFATFSGPVTLHPDNDLNQYLHAKYPTGSRGLLPADRNKLIRKTGYKTLDGHYECANQFGY